MLFTLHTTPLGAVIQGHNLDDHFYADYAWVYISLATLYASRSLSQLNGCLQYIFYWKTNSKLKLNAENTEYLIIGTPVHRRKLYGLFPNMYPESKRHSSYLWTESRRDLGS